MKSSGSAPLIVFSLLACAFNPAQAQLIRQRPIVANSSHYGARHQGKSHRVPMPSNLEHAILAADFKTACDVLNDRTLINCANAKGQTPLSLALRHFAFQENNFPPDPGAAARNSALAFEIWLVQHGADVNVDPGGNGVTPLMDACQMRSLSLVQAMCTHGADTLAIANSKQTALIFTFLRMGFGKYGDISYGGDSETKAMLQITAYLLTKPVKINAQDSLGSTALDYCLDYHYAGCAHLLRARGARHGSHRIGLLRDGSYVKVWWPGGIKTIKPGTRD